MRKLLGIITVLALAILAYWALFRANEELPYSYAYSQDGYVYTYNTDDQGRANRKALRSCKAISSKPQTCIVEPWNKQVCVVFLYCANKYYQKTIKAEGKTINEAEINALRSRPTGQGQLACEFHKIKLCP